MKPTQKVASGGLAGALTVIVVYVLGLLGADLPPEVASALTVLIGTGTAYIKTENAPAE